MRIQPTRLRGIGLLAATGALTLALAAPAGAETTTTFEVSDSGDLSISVPTAQSFTGLTRAGGEVAFADPITVTDARDDLIRSWSVTVSDDLGAGFTNNNPDIDVTLQPSEVLYQPGAMTTIEGALSAEVITTSDETLDSGAAVVSAEVIDDLGLTEDVAEWQPSLDVTPAEGLPDGTYEGTIIHSLSG